MLKIKFICHNCKKEVTAPIEVVLPNAPEKVISFCPKCGGINYLIIEKEVKK